MDDKCRLCSRPYVDNLDRGTRSCLVCAHHRAMVIETIREARALDRHSRLLGFGLPLDSAQGNEAPLRCDKSLTDYEAHTWTGSPGDYCPFCLALYLDTLVDERNRLLGAIDIDPEDERYFDEVKRRTKRLASALSLGLVTPTEARASFDRWASNV
jgi:hypothetical protein